MKRKKIGKLAKLVCGGAIAVASIFNPIKASPQEITPKPLVEQTLEKKVSEPSIEISFNYGTESKQEEVEYFLAHSRFFNRLLWTNFPEITPEEVIEVENVINDVGDGVINSNEDFINITKDFSENQKIVLISTIGHLLRRGNYNSFYMTNNKVFSQDVFFNKLQYYLRTGYQNPLGICRHLSSHLEQLANDIGIRTAAVSGVCDEEAHTFCISKIENRTAINDEGFILVVDSKNIEKALRAYQEDVNSVSFYHLFFNDNKFKYRLITKDGRNFLNFIGYDETSEKVKNSLIQKNNFSKPDISFKINLEDYLTSAELNCFGFFGKAGQIKGDSMSAIDKMNLFQIGYDKNFMIKDLVNINPNISFVFGNLLKNVEDDTDENLLGISGDLFINTKNEKGLNLSSRIAGHINSLLPITGSSSLFFDLAIEAGASYKIPLKKIDIEPYLIAQFNSFPGDLGVYNFVPMLNEVRAGANFDFKISDDAKLSIEPYGVRRIWEHEFGGDVNFESKYFGVGAGGYGTISNYYFCPDKYGFDFGAYLKLKNFLLKANYELEGTNYDGEIENQSSFNVQGSFRS